MGRTDIHLSDVFSKNRAEELPDDVWGQFVIPPYYDKLDIERAEKTRCIEGGRGCGKTMLIRYFCHPTVFSPRREEIPESALGNVGLYWRPNIQFTNMFTGWGLSQQQWAAAFRHYGALLLLQEVVAAVHNMARSCIEYVNEDVFAVGTEWAAQILPDAPQTIGEWPTFIEDEILVFESWLNNPRAKDERHVLPGVPVVTQFINRLQDRYEPLAQTKFHVFIDEFENFHPFQQRIINDWIKHTRRPLIISVAYKRAAQPSRETTGGERIQERDDFRIFDLDDLLDDGEFEIFAAEIMSLRMAQAGFDAPDISLDLLTDPSRVDERAQSGYRDRLKEFAQSVLPGYDIREIAAQLYRSSAGKNRIRRRIAEALRRKSDGTEYTTDDFLGGMSPTTALTAMVLLARPGYATAEQVLSIINEKDEEARQALKDLEHNNLFGAVLLIYQSLTNRPCLVYSGFSVFCLLAKGNVRHFQELLYQSFLKKEHADSGSEAIESIQVSPEHQASAAYKAAERLLEGIHECGRFGHRLRYFAKRLGVFYQALHRNPAQSESEQNHFAIDHYERLDEDSVMILDHARMWGILDRMRRTKSKDPHEPALEDYVLNPIYAPFFRISYRRKRRVVLRGEELMIMIKGTDEEFRRLLRERAPFDDRVVPIQTRMF